MLPAKFQAYNERKDTMARKKKERPGALRTVGKIFGTLLTVLLTLMLIGIIVGGIVAATFWDYCKEYLIDDEYDIVDLQHSLDMTSKIYYPVYSDIARTELVGYEEMEDQRIHGAENRYWAPIQHMPENLKNAFIAIEDQRFYEHGGFDFKRTAGAALELLKGNKSYGGSTITQQLIKNITDERDTTIQRKITEISRAVSLTEKKTKDEVLEMYLNTIPLSHGNYGVAAAANYFFDKDVSELTLVECAAIASIPKSPTKYDPERNPDNNAERRKVVLTAMRDQELISEDEYLEAWHAQLNLNINREETVSIVHSYFTDELRRQVQNDLMEEYGYTKELAQQMILSGGLEIYATVDPYIQNIMEEVYESESTFKKGSGDVQPESAMVVVDPYSGHVLGIVGGRWEKTSNMTLNRATMSRRQIGSSIKPVSVYAPAMEMGIIDYGTVIDDTPLEWNGKRYWPKNSPATYDGKTTVERAIMVSKNTVAAKLVDDMTPQYVYDFLTKRLGVKSLVKSDIDIAPLALGGLTYGMTTLEVAGCYTMLASGDGTYSEPIFYTKVLDSKGNVILDSTKLQHREAVISEETAKTMTKLLTTVVSSGTAKALKLDSKFNVAAKTGTTNDNNDVYFVGYTPYYLGAAWFGYDIPRSLAKFGTNQAMVGWEAVMTRIHERVEEQEKANGQKRKTFSYSGLSKASYCKDSGLKPGPYCKLDPRGDRIASGWFKNPPKQTCDCHYPVECCAETGLIANEYCPATVSKALVLVGEERVFEHNLKITDAKYSIMEMPEGYISPADSTVAIFANMLTGNQSYGYTKSEEFPPNAVCTAHNYDTANPPVITDPTLSGDGTVTLPDGTVITPVIPPADNTHTEENMFDIIAGTENTNGSADPENASGVTVPDANTPEIQLPVPVPVPQPETIPSETSAT